MNNTIYIYTLSNPVTETIFYVGKATNLKSRMKSHLSEGKRAARRGYWHNPKHEAMQEIILDYEAEPLMICVDETTEDMVYRVELNAIAHYEALGCPLTNRECSIAKNYHEHITKRMQVRVRNDVYFAHHFMNRSYQTYDIQYCRLAASAYENLAYKYANTVIADDFAKYAAKCWKIFNSDNAHREFSTYFPTNRMPHGYIQLWYHA